MIAPCSRRSRKSSSTSSTPYEEYKEAATSLSASVPEAAAEPGSSAVALLRKAEREGALIAELLTKVFRLQNQVKMADPAALRETIPKGKVLGLSALSKTALDLEHRFFCSAALLPLRPPCRPHPSQATRVPGIALSY